MVEIALIAACSNGVAPETLQAIIDTESGGRVLAIATNPPRQLPNVTTAEEAGRLLNDLIAKRISVDIGLMQINSQHIARFKLQPADLFDPCTNIFVGSTILSEGYSEASKRLGPGQAALREALSIYNTGDPRAGFSNGYVGRVVGLSMHEDDALEKAAKASSLEVPFDIKYGRSDNVEYSQTLHSAFGLRPSN